MTYPRFLRHASFLLLTGIGLGRGPVVFAQTPDNAPLPSRVVSVVQLDASQLPVRRHYPSNPWQVGLPTGWYINRLSVPRILNVWYRGRPGWTADELLAQIPLGHIRRVQRLSPAVFQATYGPSSLGADGALFIQVSGERQLLQALRRDGAVPFPRRRNKCSHCM